MSFLDRFSFLPTLMNRQFLGAKTLHSTTTRIAKSCSNSGFVLVRRGRDLENFETHIDSFYRVGQRSNRYIVDALDEIFIDIS